MPVARFKSWRTTPGAAGTPVRLTGARLVGRYGRCPMKKFAAAAFLVGLFGIAYAADPSGTWTWKTKFGKDGKEIDQTLKLKLDGDKVTGTMSGGRGGKGGKGGGELK